MSAVRRGSFGVVNAPVEEFANFLTCWRGRSKADDAVLSQKRAIPAVKT